MHSPLLTDYTPVIIFPQSPIQASQLPKLHLPQIVLVLRGLNTLLQNVSYLGEGKQTLLCSAEATTGSSGKRLPCWHPHLFYCFLHILHGIGSNQGMKWLIFSRQHLAIFAPNFPFFHGSLPPDHDLGITLLLYVLQGISPTRGRKD